MNIRTDYCGNQWSTPGHRNCPNAEEKKNAKEGKRATRVLNARKEKVEPLELRIRIDRIERDKE
ncbi:hypothetical protein N7535_008455 [Penicillium sp. DV-2018c]|nr:hypothetical protein N7461_002213 [Penicillium sp. DV-2018c]KAJ5563291.1 hypothetical protein N7535_008455 [Penicillium sp. DV-2018c]